MCYGLYFILFEAGVGLGAKLSCTFIIYCQYKRHTAVKCGFWTVYIIQLGIFLDIFVRFYCQEILKKSEKDFDHQSNSYKITNFKIQSFKILQMHTFLIYKIAYFHDDLRKAVILFDPPRRIPIFKFFRDFGITQHKNFQTRYIHAKYQSSFKTL